MRQGCDAGQRGTRRPATAGEDARRLPRQPQPAPALPAPSEPHRRRRRSTPCGPGPKHSSLRRACRDRIRAGLDRTPRYLASSPIPSGSGSSLSTRLPDLFLDNAWWISLGAIGATVAAQNPPTGHQVGVAAYASALPAARWIWFRRLCGGESTVVQCRTVPPSTTVRTSARALASASRSPLTTMMSAS